MTTQKLSLIGLVLLSLAYGTFRGSASAQAPETSGGQSRTQGTKTIAFLIDGGFPFTAELFHSIQSELVKIAGHAYSAEFLPTESADWNPARVEELLAQALKDPKVDMVVVSGPNFSQAVKLHIPLSKPVVIASLLNPDISGLPATPEGTTGVRNLYYVAKSATAEEELRLFQRICRFEKLHLLVDRGIAPYARKVVERLGKTDAQIEVLDASGSVEQILERVDAVKPQALYLTPLPLTEEDYLRLIAAINERRIPTFSSAGYKDVKAGVLAGRMLKVSSQFSKRIALTLDRILQGEDAGAIETAFDVEDRLVVNRRTANQIGLSLPFSLLMDAEVLNRSDTQGESLTLKQVVRLVMENNLNFRVIDELIKAVSRDYWLAWTQYLPKIEFNLNYGLVDFAKERYGTSVPKRSFDWEIGLNQLIFSHPVIRAISNAKKQIAIENLNRETAELDISRRTILAYLNFLRAKALLKVDDENLKAVSENLAVARRRLDTGAAGREEVLRWEAELADRKAVVLLRESSIAETRVILNQLMNRAQETLFTEQEVGLETVKYYIDGQSLRPYVRNGDALRVFLEFSVQEALRRSPEVKALEFGIEQQRNNIKSADGKFVLPEVTLDAGTRHDVYEKYAGDGIPGDNDREELLLKMSYPLFDRGRRPVDSMKQRDILHQLEYALSLKKQEIERDLRRAAYGIASSLPSIELKRQAMAGAVQEYEIMKHQYKEGLVSYVDLVNVQVDTFQREANAVIAVYDFFTNLVEFDRQGVRFYMLASEEERLDWLARVSDYMKSRGV